jgi:hypothetical protein
MRKTKVPFAVFSLLACLMFAAAGTHSADEPREIMWKDLVPPVAKSFPKLTKPQALQLSDIADVRERKARGDKVNAIELEDERGAARKLEEAGFDVDALLALRKEYMDGSKQRAQSVVGSLDGQTVRMPGYVLPLEFSGKDVTEFLLVPYVGACIHTPPPPANQIVHVKADKPVANVTVFSAVWVTGRITAVSMKKSLNLVDGAADINVGYSLQANAVETYKQ